ADEVGSAAAAAALDVVQLHDDPDAAAVTRVRAAAGLPVWAVARVSGAELPARLAELFAMADAVVLDARVAGRLGGTGTTFDWEGVRAALDQARGSGRLVLAGGLTAENVAEAIRVLRPDVVDVSSGVESAPGIKSPARMRRFAAAARAAEVPA
ncbi:MAG TPA: phosphoribosylanthranilate isomerase, partial [Gemmatimonadaceae bacterium]|nr:phosphoribosylanthranilate isomerase [Gemmatimonadaceae bacterium]